MWSKTCSRKVVQKKGAGCGINNQKVESFNGLNSVWLAFIVCWWYGYCSGAADSLRFMVQPVSSPHPWTPCRNVENLQKFQYFNLFLSLSVTRATCIVFVDSFFGIIYYKRIVFLVFLVLTPCMNTRRWTMLLKLFFLIQTQNSWYSKCFLIMTRYLCWTRA